MSDSDWKPEVERLVAEGKLERLSAGRYRLLTNGNELPARVWSAVEGMEAAAGKPVVLRFGHGSNAARAKSATMIAGESKGTSKGEPGKSGNSLPDQPALFSPENADETAPPRNRSYPR